MLTYYYFLLILEGECGKSDSYYMVPQGNLKSKANKLVAVFLFRNTLVLSIRVRLFIDLSFLPCIEVGGFT